jgi:selenophosphate synthetase-related protein
MAPDYDLSTLPSEQVDLWICLQADAICGQIIADQAARLGFPLALVDCIVASMAAKPQAIFNNG